jgi:hypothetical protein
LLQAAGGGESNLHGVIFCSMARQSRQSKSHWFTHAVDFSLFHVVVQLMVVVVVVVLLMLEKGSRSETRRNT